MNITTYVTLLCVPIFFGMMLCFHWARILGKRRIEQTGHPGLDSDIMVGAVFGLLGLLIAFSFSGAYSRYEVRRQIILEETNAIGTAYLRVDLLPEQAQPEVRVLFRKYTESRARFYDDLATDVQKASDNLVETAQLQQAIWTASVQNTGGTDNNAARMLLLPALNNMIDIVTTRTLAVQTHPPSLIFISLGVLALICAWFAGYAARASDRPLTFYSLSFALVISFMLFVILDIEFPAHGFINLNEVNALLYNLAGSMH